MPKCGSQIILCDIPIRFDTYEGCGHACTYCFVSKKSDISNIKVGESADSLLRFIEGKRTKLTEWCDWDIPLHWGGVSDPFQPVERVKKRSLEALKVFAKTHYPFVVSTKSSLISEEPYLSLIKECNCVVQFSLASPKYDQFEKGASPYIKRLEAASKIAQYKRVILRVQPYIPEIYTDVLSLIKQASQMGIYGIVVEAMKHSLPKKGLIRIGGDFVYPVKTLIPQFESIKRQCHRYGMKFYSGENRLRSMGDNLCCCGCEGLGWRVNTANLNHILFDKQGVNYTPLMMLKGTAYVFKSIEQNALANKEIPHFSYMEKMQQKTKEPYAYMENGKIYVSKE